MDLVPLQHKAVGGLNLIFFLQWTLNSCLIRKHNHQHLPIDCDPFNHNKKKLNSHVYTGDMTFVGSLHGCSLSPAIILNTHKPPIRPTPPIFISTKLLDVNPNNLQDLCTACNHSFNRFPNMLQDGRVEPDDVDKIRTALFNSSVVVSVFARPEPATGGGDWYRRMIPLTPVTGELVGFGRAVSDDALTASIYDVMVIPSLQGRGIGRMILQRIIRLLTSKGIYDIAALCSDQDMKFFKACGFGDDMLGSTTMMYTRSGNDLVVSAGRKLLMVPPLRKP